MIYSNYRHNISNCTICIPIHYMKKPAGLKTEGYPKHKMYPCLGEISIHHFMFII